MKIATIVSKIGKASGGIGPVVLELSDQLSRHGHENMIFAGTDDGDSGNADSSRIQKFPCSFPRFWGYASGWSKAVEKWQPDIIHSHWMWQYSSYLAYRKSKRLHIPSVITPHGMLDPYALKISAWKKTLARWVFENPHLKHATCIHALCESEYQAIRQCGITTPVAVIPNGISLPEMPQSHPEKEKKTLLYFGRITPKKGPDVLIRAWKRLQNSHPELIRNWHLEMVGWGEPAYVSKMKTLILELGMTEKITFYPPAFGAQKEKFFSQADAFILPSFSEGLPITVLEAWSYSLPALITKECNFPEAFPLHAAIRITPVEEELAMQLVEFFKQPAEFRREIGLNARKLAKQQFSWEKIGDQLVAMYHWCLGQGDKPSFIKE